MSDSHPLGSMNEQIPPIQSILDLVNEGNIDGAKSELDKMFTNAEITDAERKNLISEIIETVETHITETILNSEIESIDFRNIRYLIDRLYSLGLITSEKKDRVLVSIRITLGEQMSEWVKDAGLKENYKSSRQSMRSKLLEAREQELISTSLYVDLDRLLEK